MAPQLQVCCSAMAKMRSLAFFLVVMTCQAAPLVFNDEGWSSGYFEMEQSFNMGDYYQTNGATSACPSGYQFITDETACQELAGIVAGKVAGEAYTYTSVNPFPKYCTTRAVNDVNYYYNPPGTSTDVSIGLLCINSNKTCSVDDGTGSSSEYPCVCGTDTCSTGEVCNAAANVCEVIQGYYETERTASSCPSGYQPILDEKACRQVAMTIPDRTFGHVISYSTVPHGCSAWTKGIVNYYVNPGGTNTEIDVALICIKTSMACSVTDGSAVSSSYPCVCGTDTCATDEYCDTATGVCEVVKGFYETERMASSCPTGYQMIPDAGACEELAGQISDNTWGHTFSDTTLAHGCGSRLSNIVNYYVNPGGTNTDVKNALMCIKSSSTCDVDDGSGVSSSYPCVCGTDTCSSGEICIASANKCEVIRDVYETDRMANSCPAGYKTIDNEHECYTLAQQINHKKWIPFKLYSATATGCGTWKTHTINYFSNPGGVNTDASMALLCKLDTR